MAKKKEYHRGDIICKETGVIYLEELSPRVKYYNGYRTEYRKVRALCPCGRTFEKELSDIKRGSLCQNCGLEKARSARTKYPEGSIFGEYNTILVHRGKKVGKTVECVFECGRCHKTFEMTLTDFLKSNYQVCPNCVSELSKPGRCKYNPGDIIENPNHLRFYFEKELPVNAGQMRRGIFYEINNDNLQIGSRFAAIVYNVVCGSADGSNSRANNRFLRCLKELPYIYKTEVSFPDLLSDKGYPLRYDFGIYNNDNQLILVELDGQQHFYPIDYFGGDEQYQKQLRNDELKNIYAKDNGYTLIRIPYTKFSSITPDLIVQLIEGGE